ncbi:uncharacterized protein LOC123915646 [Trifolium pratense]|uniref:uncharacterized protein LOC123915646 n=1 Tax=Trifolium pratense TaxID=57577 RepID=UPI001E692B87|nr:uncharacterized protein LOC123915646 [Trifolium pratense]
MATKPLTPAIIALTEKKMDMTLDDIIKMSKNPKPIKGIRVSNKSRKFSNTIAQDKSLKAQRYMESRSSLRQGELAKRRSNFQGNQFPLATEVARKAVAAPLHYGVNNRNKMANWNKPRFHVPVNQRRAASGGFVAKPLTPPQQQHQHQHQNDNIKPNQRSNTMDSLFANMKEQRMKAFSRQNNAVQHNGAGNRRPQWGRGRHNN